MLKRNFPSWLRFEQTAAFILMILPIVYLTATLWELGSRGYADWVNDLESINYISFYVYCIFAFVNQYALMQADIFFLQQMEFFSQKRIYFFYQCCIQLLGLVLLSMEANDLGVLILSLLMSILNGFYWHLTQAQSKEFNFPISSTQKWILLTLLAYCPMICSGTKAHPLKQKPTQELKR